MISWRNSTSPAQEQDNSSGLLTTKEAADLIGISEGYAQALGKRGILKRACRRKSYSFLYLRSDVEALAEKRRQQFERLKKLKSKRRVKA